MTTQKSPAKYAVTPLRQAQHELTRSRIRDAGRELFYEKHYDATTMEDIANRAGLRRSTVYLHFKDKAAILEAIVLNYMPRARAQMETLPGPAPTVAKLVEWIENLSDFFERERAPIAIALEAGQIHQGAGFMRDLMQNVLEGLGKHNRAFEVAAAPTGELVVKARAVLLVNQLTTISRSALRGGDESWNVAMRVAVAEQFHEFLLRFQDEPIAPHLTSAKGARAKRYSENGAHARADN
jgi:AcrR family transcriptional regulator